ncbi:MAG: hypothetical protein B6244_14140 [Candidatus Cloacimonetes bacterium 4572_55]|nr:MAG: hypothetical protein B6244_14140 [Candidatus Cloacimonetes bacterium 4572_55]
MNIGITVTGAKEVEKMLHKLERKDSAKIARTETRQAQKDVMLPAVKSNAITMVSGMMGSLIAKNLAVRAMTKMKRGSYGAKVIIKPTDAFVSDANGVRSYIPNAIEYGHAAANDAGGVKVTSPIPFKREAYEAKRRPLAAKLAKEMVKAIERAAKI